MACGGGGGGSGGGGGGGGGGSGVKGIPLSTFAGGAPPAGKPSSLSEAIGPGPSAGLTTANPSKGVNGYVREGGLWDGPPDTVSLSIYGDTVKVVSSQEGTGFLSANDMTVFSNGLVGTVVDTISEPLTPANTGIPGISGNVAASEVVMLGGKAVGLEYTNFGFWEARATYTGKLNGVNFNFTDNSYKPFILESTAARKIAPPGTGSFSGVVLANAYERDTGTFYDKVVSLVGKANLSLASATAGEMKFSFDNFYTLATNLTIGSNGQITGNSGFTVVSGLNNTGINFPVGGKNTLNGPIYSLLEIDGSSYLEGQFYGKSGDSSPSEAVGTFGYYSKSGLSHTTGLIGTWGVKK